ncbi:abscisic acid 8'-hydroxylase 1-like [Canna indica]|uniref:(+)-abscisic acid 8'-hydroxylase n=1 Tax=Canna indica TaxID=4628 RepID=A0AAQ3KRD8_9LILI|nr:abscisic acid 8'-hydroxylase 1-like [Canna indica]
MNSTTSPIINALLPAAILTTASMSTLLLPMLILILSLFLFLFLAGRRKSRKLPLPPGSMGWPYVGETFQLYSNNPNTFFALKQNRYGPIFKSHILGCPCVMVSSPEAARFVLTRANLFKPTFPKSKERMIGPQAIFFQQGEYHTRLRRLVLRAFLPEAIRGSVAGIENVALRALQSWDGRLVNTFQELKTYAFNVAIVSIFGKDEISYLEDLKQCYYTLEKGYNSMPINLPGTLFYKAMKARQQLAQIVAQIVSSRRMQRKTEANDLLGSFMEAKEDLSDDQIADNVIGVIFAARDTTASVLTWIVKYLGDNPSILQAVTEEQEEIRKSKEESGDEDRSLTWIDTKRMPLTSRVIQETMRVASILSFTFREAVEDVEYEGYLIPKGWKVLPLFRNIHHSQEIFTDPDKFDPSRFEVAPKPNTFMPFGNGTHSCPGNELAKLEMLVLLHHLTTKYRWSMMGSESGIQFGPFVLPLNGLPLRFSLKSRAEEQAV